MNQNKPLHSKAVSVGNLVTVVRKAAMILLQTKGYVAPVGGGGVEGLTCHLFPWKSYAGTPIAQGVLRRQDALRLLLDAFPEARDPRKRIEAAQVGSRMVDSK